MAVSKQDEALDQTIAHDEAEGRERGVSALRFRLAVLRHHRIVFGVASSLLGDRHEAEDVTHEAFLRYWQRGADVRNARDWLLEVARNGCIDRLRRAHRFVDADLPDDRLHEHRDPAWHLEQQQLSAQLGSLIGRLPEPQRSLIVMFDVHGLDGTSCARILGLNTNQVKVYLHRARRRLREQLEESS